MRTGALRNRCTMLKPVRTKNSTAGFIVTWDEVGKLWADIAMPSGRVSPVAEQISALVTAEILIRPRAGVVAGNRLVHTSKGVSTTYLIEAALLNSKRDMLRLLCSNVANP